MDEAQLTAMLGIAIEEARLGLSEGGIPIGAALFERSGRLLGRGHNRRVQEDDPSIHGETDAFRKAGRRRSYQDTVMVTTLAHVLVLRCGSDRAGFGASGLSWVGESRDLSRRDRPAARTRIEVIDLDSPDCANLLAASASQAAS